MEIVILMKCRTFRKDASLRNVKVCENIGGM